MRGSPWSLGQRLTKRNILKTLASAVRAKGYSWHCCRPCRRRFRSRHLLAWLMMPLLMPLLLSAPRHNVLLVPFRVKHSVDGGRQRLGPAALHPSLLVPLIPPLGGWQGWVGCGKAPCRDSCQVRREVDGYTRRLLAQRSGGAVGRAG